MSVRDGRNVVPLVGEEAAKCQVEILEEIGNLFPGNEEIVADFMHRIKAYSNGKTTVQEFWKHFSSAVGRDSATKLVPKIASLIMDDHKRVALLEGSSFLVDEVEVRQPKVDEMLFFAPQVLLKKYPELFVPKDSLEIGALIGEGGFGQVYESLLHKKMKVAYKKINNNVVMEAGEELYREVYTMMTLNTHPNIVTVIGVIVDVTDDSNYGFGMILELASLGTLYQRINNNELDFSLELRLQILSDICNGVEALHANHIVHADLKSMNILLFDSGEGEIIAKISDFGMAKVTSSTVGLRTGGKGTLNWCAPEVFGTDDDDDDDKEEGEGEEAGKDAISESTVGSKFPIDIWALGMVFYEMFTRKMPFEKHSEPQICKKLLIKKELPNMKLIEDKLVPPSLVNLIIICCNFNPSLRPTIQTLNMLLSEEISKLNKASTANTANDMMPRSTKNYDLLLEMMKEMKIMQRNQTLLASQLSNVEKGVSRIEATLQEHMVQMSKILTSVIDISNDVNEFPPLFLILPKPPAPKSSSSSLTSSLSKMFLNNFKTSDDFLIIFLCEHTLTPIKYNNTFGLEFSQLKESIGSKASSLSNVLSTYGPIIKVASAAISTVVKASSGIELSDLLPLDAFEYVGNFAREFESTKDFLFSYNQALSQFASQSNTLFDMLDPNEGIESLLNKVDALGVNGVGSASQMSRENYIKFLSFFKSKGYDRHLLDAQKLAVVGDDRMHWVKSSAVLQASSPFTSPPSSLASSLSSPSPPSSLTSSMAKTSPLSSAATLSTPSMSSLATLPSPPISSSSVKSHEGKAAEEREHQLQASPLSTTMSASSQAAPVPVPVQAPAKLAKISQKADSSKVTTSRNLPTEISWARDERARVLVDGSFTTNTEVLKKCLKKPYESTATKIGVMLSSLIADDGGVNQRETSKLPVLKSLQDVTGSIHIKADSKKPLNYNSIYLELICEIEFFEDSRVERLFSSRQELFGSGSTTKCLHIPFRFDRIDKKYDSYYSHHSSVRWYVRLSIIRSIIKKDIVVDGEFVVQKLEDDLSVFDQPKVHNIEFGIGEILLIELDHDELRRYHLNDTITLTLNMKLLKMKMKKCVFAIVRSETIFKGKEKDNKRFDIFDATHANPIKQGEPISFQVSLQNVRDLRYPAFDIKNQLLVEYFVCIRFEDSQDRKYFKQYKLKISRKNFEVYVDEERLIVE